MTVYCRLGQSKIASLNDLSVQTFNLSGAWLFNLFNACMLVREDLGVREGSRLVNFENSLNLAS